MARACVVHRDLAVAEREATALRRLGLDVDQCGGPMLAACPVLDGRPCPHAEWADVLVYDLATARRGHGGRLLFDELRAVYADKPIVMVGFDRGVPRLLEPDLGRGVIRLVGEPTPDRLAWAIEEALGDR